MSDENYIDKLYKDSFQSFEIQPKKGLNFKEHQQLANTVEKKPFLKKLFASKWGIALSVAFIAIISLVLVLILNSKKARPENTKTEIIVVEPKVVEEAVTIVDTATTIEAVPVKTEIKKQIITKTAEKLNTEAKIDSIVQPVIIRKTIIKRDTILKHEKVIQNVPVTNEK